MVLKLLYSQIEDDDSDASRVEEEGVLHQSLPVAAGAEDLSGNCQEKGR
jgi:hypothetical protein